MHHIYVMNSDGSALSRITNSRADDSEPAWSRDSKRIAFVRAIDGNTEIFVVNADGSNESRLTNDPGADVSPSWSIDGRIFFTSNRGGKRQIYFMNADGSAVTQFITINAFSPAWSPSGTKITFISTSQDTGSTYNSFQVFVADLDGSNIRLVTKAPTSTFVPCWSGDENLAFADDNVGVASNIIQVDLKGDNLRRLTAGPKFDTQPAISPDGSKLAFQSNRSGNYEIYLKSLR